jgi:hypothetical protein
MTGFELDLLCAGLFTTGVVLVLAVASYLEWCRRPPHFGTITEMRPERPAVSNVVPIRRPPYDWSTDEDAERDDQRGPA